jgi:hypothetical protein
MAYIFQYTHTSPFTLSQYMSSMLFKTVAHELEGWTSLEEEDIYSAFIKTVVITLS